MIPGSCNGASCGGWLGGTSSSGGGGSGSGPAGGAGEFRLIVWYRIPRLTITRWDHAQHRSAPPALTSIHHSNPFHIFIIRLDITIRPHHIPPHNRLSRHLPFLHGRLFAVVSHGQMVVSHSTTCRKSRHRRSRGPTQAQIMDGELTNTVKMVWL